MTAASQNQAGEAPFKEKRGAEVVFSWRVASPLADMFLQDIRNALQKKAVEFEIEASLLQPLAGPGDAIWQLRINAPDFASLAKLLDDECKDPNAATLPRIAMAGVSPEASRDQADIKAGVEMSGDPVLYRTWVFQRTAAKGP